MFMTLCQTILKNNRSKLPLNKRKIILYVRRIISLYTLLIQQNRHANSRNNPNRTK
jgi:hypothetical protein